MLPIPTGTTFAPNEGKHQGPFHACSQLRQGVGQGLVENSALQDFVTEINPAAIKHLLDPKLAAYVDLTGPRTVVGSKELYESEFVRDAMEIIDLFDRALIRR